MLKFRFAATLAAAALFAGIGLSAPDAARAQGRVPQAGFADLVEKLLPAVVNISTTQNVQTASGPQPNRRERQAPEGLPQAPPGSPFEELFKDFFERNPNMRSPRPVTSLGSGFIIDSKGIVVTNNHVIADADEIKVILHDKTELAAKIIGRDPKVDLAVLKIEAKQPLKAITWGRSDKSRVGDWVIAIGNPLGLGGTVTAGIVSARGRDIGSGPYDDFIQTDAPINKGNSGGPLFNIDGEVIGINTAIYSPSGGSIGIGFAVPSALAEPVVNQLQEFGRTKRGWLGVRIQRVTDEIAEGVGLDKPRGAMIADVNPGGPADKAKIEKGDIVTSFDGKPVPEMNQLPRLVAATPIGKQVDVEVFRKGKARSLKVTVGELDESEAQVASADAPKGQTQSPRAGNATLIESLGLRLSAINAEARQKFNIKPDVKGVVVVEVAPDGPAAKQDIRVGDVIVEVNQDEVKSPDEVVSKVNEARKDPKRRNVLLYVQRGGDTRFIGVPFKG